MSLPQRPLDGQEFIDAYRIVWRHNSETNSWIPVGIMQDMPEASKDIAGFMTPHQLKVLHKSNDGNTAFITDTKLIHRNLHPPAITTGKVLLFVSDINDYKLFTYVTNMTKDAFAGNTLLIGSQSTLILGNEQNYLLLDKEIIANDGDIYEIVDTKEYNSQGFIYGDLTINSDSINFNSQIGIDNSKECCYNEAQDKIVLSLNDDFTGGYCLEIPECKGEKGDKGPKGDSGVDGYDPNGPKGDPGDDGADATEIPSELGDVNITDVDELTTTAVVDLELDKTNGILYAVKSGVSLDNYDADRAVVKPTYRDIELIGNDENLKFKIIDDDNTEVDDDKLLVLKNEPIYDDYNTPKIVFFKDFVQMIIDNYTDQYLDIITKIKKNAIEFMNNKDKEVRTILANLAQQLTECQWQMPIDFSLKVSQVPCGAEEEGVPTPLSGGECPPNQPGGGGGGGGGSSATSTATAQAKASIFINIGKGNNLIPSDTPEQYIDYIPIDTVSVPADTDGVPVQLDGSSTLPDGIYTISYNAGSVKNGDGPHIVGGVGSDVGLKAEYWDMNGNSGVESMPDPVAAGLGEIGWDSAELQSAYRDLDSSLNSIMVPIENRGTILLKANTDGETRGIGAIHVDIARITVEEC